MKMDFKINDGERLDKINENLTIIEKVGGLTFGTDAYLLSAFVKRGKNAADLGSGTGVAALLCLARNKADHFYTVEIQQSFADLIERNAKNNGFSDKVSVINKDIRNVTEIPVESLDYVISNPPYMSAVSGFGNNNDEMNIARRELNGTISDFCNTASKLLKYGGIFYTVFRPDRLSELFSALCDNNLEPKKLVTVYSDSSSKPCLVLVESKKGASHGLNYTRPLIIYKYNTRDYTEDMQKVYDTCSLSHLF